MKKLLTAAFLTGALGVTVSAALANPILGPVSAPAPHVFAVPVNTVHIQNTMLAGYRGLRTFWLSRAVIR
jgi:hypothetical protein